MPYTVVTDFRQGMDRRRKRAAGTPGALWVGKNVLISRGGDIERAKKMVPAYTLPANTFGLGALRNQMYVFGSVAEPTGMPVNIKYQRLQAADAATNMVELLDVDTFDGAFYVIARFDDGNVHHFYDGARVTDWDTLAATSFDFPTLASYMADLIDEDAVVSASAVGSVITITARDPGTAFSITKATVDLGGTSDQDITLVEAQANVAEVAEVQASTVVTFVSGSSGTVEDITINSVSLMRDPVSWGTSHTATLAAVAVQINNKTATHGYTAESAGNALTITAAPGTGATPNEYAVAPAVTGDLLLSAPSMSGGVTPVEPVAQVYTATFSGTEQAADRFIITINAVVYAVVGRAAATGTSAFAHKKRMWSPANSLWQYCKLIDAADWSDANVASGSGFFNISQESYGNERLVGAAAYGRQAAVFSRNSIHIWNTSTDASDITIDSTLGNTGALAARAIMQYGNLDLFYIDEPGVRSLRAHQQTGEAYAEDIGHPIDSFLREYMDTLSEGQIRRAVGIIGPEGRPWFSIGSRVFVLSYFPASKVVAWTYHEHGISITDFAKLRNRLYARAADTIYLYGGADDATYPDDDERTDIVSLPFITAQTPATVKQLTGFDIACTGEWLAEMLLDPNDENVKTVIGRLTKTTYNLPNGRIGVPGRTSHMALDLTCTKGGAATISSLALHYDVDEAT